MRNLFIPSGTIEFIGSKERLQKTVTRSGGKLLPLNEYQLPLATSGHRHIKFTFSAQGNYAQTEHGFQITYRILPTTATKLRYLVTLVIAVVAVIALFFVDDVRKSPLVILFIPGLLFGFRTHCKYCEKAFCKLFSTATGSHKGH